jgi:hypothetical protein
VWTPNREGGHADSYRVRIPTPSQMLAQMAIVESQWLTVADVSLVDGDHDVCLSDRRTLDAADRRQDNYIEGPDKIDTSTQQDGEDVPAFGVIAIRLRRHDDRHPSCGPHATFAAGGLPVDRFERSAAPTGYAAGSATLVGQGPGPLLSRGRPNR